MAYVPANVISEKHRQYWSKDTFVLPEYHFAFEQLKDEYFYPTFLKEKIFELPETLTVYTELR